jgi:hypothetical protein
MKKFTKVNESLSTDVEYAFGILEEMGYIVICERFNNNFYRITISIRKTDTPPLMSPQYININEINSHITHINECVDLVRKKFKNIYLYIDGGSNSNKSCGFRLFMEIL